MCRPEKLVLCWLEGIALVALADAQCEEHSLQGRLPPSIAPFALSYPSTGAFGLDHAFKGLSCGKSRCAPVQDLLPSMVIGSRAFARVHASWTIVFFKNLPGQSSSGAAMVAMTKLRVAKADRPRSLRFSLSHVVNATCAWVTDIPAASDVQCLPCLHALVIAVGRGARACAEQCIIQLDEVSTNLQRLSHAAMTSCWC